MNKTIASLALIKINWVNKQDFIEIFVSFVITLISKKGYENFDINEICKDFLSEFGLCIPYHPMITIMNRVKKRGYGLKFDKESYIPIKDKIIEGDFSDISLEQERKYNNVVKKFIEFCQQIYNISLTEKEADDIFISFLKDHDVDILFANFDKATLLPDVETSVSDKYLINSFVVNAYKSEIEIFNFILDISVGHIIANTIIQKDFASFQGKIEANYYLDSTLLFSIFGLNGKDKQEAYVEFIKVLQQNKSHIYIFQHTYEEFLGILDGCINWIENEEFDPSKASKALLFFLDNGFSTADILQFINKVPYHLKTLNIEVVDIPNINKDTRFQIDEQLFIDLIIRIYKERIPFFNEIEKDSTIYKDVKSISAIFKLRKGQRPLKISDSRYIFVTTNSSLALASRQYEIQTTGSNYFFIPVALTDVFLGTLIWIQSPSIVMNINQKRLIANSYAALQPNRNVLRKYVDIIKNMEKEDDVSEDDIILLKSSSVARTLLQSEIMGDPDKITYGIVPQILSKVNEYYKHEAELEFTNDREKYFQQNQEKDKQLLLLHQKIEEKENEINIRDVKLENSRNDIEWLIDQISKFVIGISLLITVPFILIAIIFQFFPSIFGQNIYLRWCFTIMAFFTTTLSICFGFNIKGAMTWVKNRLRILNSKRIRISNI